MSLPVVDVANALSQIALAPSSPAALANKFWTAGRTLPPPRTASTRVSLVFCLGTFFGVWKIASLIPSCNLQVRRWARPSVEGGWWEVEDRVARVGR